MRELLIDENSAGQRLDRFLGKYMSKAPTSFFYRMLRKKNIVLNGKKCEGTERLAAGDTVTLYLADDTIDQFREAKKAVVANALQNVRLNIVYEDNDILLVNKPAGMLSQKAAALDVSLTEYLIGYLLQSGQITEESLEVFRPSVCNRLDRNTSGLVICGKTLVGSREMSELLRERALKKKYLCLVNGVLSGEQRIEGYLIKDESSNQVRILNMPTKDAAPIATVYKSLANNGSETLLEVELITGKSHQIRAHLASIGHGVIGDGKYGDEEKNREFLKRYGLRIQLLHAWRLEFPELTGGLKHLSEKQFTADVPPVMRRVLAGERLWLPGIQEG